MKIKKRELLPYGAMVLFLLVLLSLRFLAGRRTGEIPSPPLSPVVIIKPMKGRLAQTVQVTGTAESANRITLVPRVPGRIDKITVQTGDRVEKNALVALIDPESYHLSLLQAESAYEAALSTYERLTALYEAGAASEEEYNRTKAQYEALDSQYRLALLQFGYTRMTSPIAGTVLAEHINSGAMAGTDTPVLTVGSISELSLKTTVPEEYLPRFLAREKNFVGTIESPLREGSIFEGTVESVSPYVSPRTGQFTVNLNLEPDSRLRPGMLLLVSFVLTERDDVWHLPLEVITEERRVWIVDEENRAEPLDYESLFETKLYGEIPSHWKDYRFILEGQHFLVPGQEVNPIGEEKG